MSEKWTPEQFWEFMKGYTGEFETGHIRDMLDDSGLILAVAPQTLGCDELRVLCRLAWNGWTDSEQSRTIIAGHEAKDIHSRDAWDRVIITITSAIADTARSSTGSEQGISISKVEGSTPSVLTTSQHALQSVIDGYDDWIASPADLGCFHLDKAIDNARAFLAADTRLTAPQPRKMTERCIDCDGKGVYPSGETCLSCGGSGRVEVGDGGPDSPSTATETKQPSFRSEVFQAAERANKRFGQWMPQQWLEIFIGEMMKEPE